MTNRQVMLLIGLLVACSLCVKAFENNLEETNLCLARAIYTQSHSLSHHYQTSRRLAQAPEKNFTPPTFYGEIIRGAHPPRKMQIDSALSFSEKEYFISCEDVLSSVSNSSSINISANNMVRFCKKLSENLNEVIKSLYYSQKIKNIFKMKLEELFELKFKNLNFNKKQSEDIDDFVERINQNLNFWVEKKQNSVVQPIINGFSKAYNIES